MLLQKLRELSERMGDLAPAMYAPTRIRWLLQIDEQGRLVGPGFVATEADHPRGQERVAPHVQRSSGVRAKLLADNAEYVLGIPRDPAKADRVASCHRAFVEEVERCAEATKEPSVEAVRRFLAELAPDSLTLPDEFDPSDNLTFRVDETIPIDLPAVRRWWAGATASAGADGEEMDCLVCGETKPVEKRQQFKLKRIPGGQPSGMALVSANAPAFESYGLEASLISPICRDCGEAFTKAANRLLRSQETHLVVGPAVYVFWTRSEATYSVVDLLSRPDPEQVRSLLSSPVSGKKEAVEIADEPFYAAALSASGGRVVVRDWIDTTVPRARENLARFFRTQALADPGQPGLPRSYGVFQLAASTVRDAQELRAEIPGALVAFALAGGRLPERLLAEAVRRNRADQQVTRPRVALIKMVLSSQDPQLEETMVELDTENRDPAYLCGRLFAVLEDVQREAIPGAKATLVDRFFGSASSAPASVFGTLLRNAQPHLAKLRKERQRVYFALEERLEDVTRHLPAFPRTLNMRQQALFSLGYYHQRARRRADIAAAVEAKRAAEAPEN